MKHEVVCITRAGLNFFHTESIDLAAKITYHCWTPGQVYDPREGVICEMFIPRIGLWG